MLRAREKTVYDTAAVNPMSQRRILYVPGKNPKPPAEVHHGLLLRCLVEGVARLDGATADAISSDEENFELIAWNFFYYGRHQDISPELRWIDELLRKEEASEVDRRQAMTWNRRMVRSLYQIADSFPVIIPWLPETLRKNAEETRRYFHNEGGVAWDVREFLKRELREQLKSGNRVLVIGHSLGSIIAYDSFWSLSQQEELRGKVDFLTLGSPLGLNYVQERLLGARASPDRRYPAMIRNWMNVSAAGDLISLDRTFADDFRGMLEAGFVRRIDDHCRDLHTWYRNDEGLNVHRSYGYLVHPVVARLVTRWWKMNA
jgi:hypothetical protein